MKSFLSVLIIFSLVFQVSCIDMFNNDKIEIGTHELILFHSSDMKGYFLGKKINESSSQIIIAPSVVYVEGNDSILLAKKIVSNNNTDTTYYKIILSEIGVKEPVILDNQEYVNIRGLINIKYGVSTIK
ncbi:hypothetical protein AAHN97_11355 [Chitinophaga niabensis]|uniref:hypothetical protein n=1 Tax=Chitinophaga niabensis TaxID=536979 RepID=UPI0031BA11D7